MEQEKVQELKDPLFQGVHCMFWIFNRQGVIQRWSELAQKELGYFRLEENLSIMEVFRREFRMTETGVEYINKDKNGFAYRKNETCFPVEMSLLLNPEDEAYYGILSAINIADRVEAYRHEERAREEAELACRIRNDFVSNVSHELRTPLNGIRGIATALRDTPLNAEQSGLLEVMECCCENMSSIINELLDFSKLEAGKFSLEERSFCFREFMRRTIAPLLPSLNEKGLALRVNIAQNVPDYLAGDELRLSQIINNLLSNSIKFTNVGQIGIEVNAANKLEDGRFELFFLVMDTGIGIEKQDIDKVFLDFSQVDSSISRKYGGTGLGLSIAKQLVELMGGSIFVQSERGKGSTFSFYVCLRHAEDEDGEQRTLKKGSFICEDAAKEMISGISLTDGLQRQPFKTRDNLYENNPIFSFGSQENQREIARDMEKLNLCIVMNNWDKAETFAKKIRILVGDEDEELKKVSFRLKLAIRKEAAEKAGELYEVLEQLIREKLKTK